MGNENQRLVLFGCKLEQQINNGMARFLIEIARGLISQQNWHIRRNGARNGNTLLLATRKLAGIMRKPMRKPHALQRMTRQIRRIAPLFEFERHGHIFQRRQRGDEMEGLEHNGQMLTPEQRAPILIHRPQILACDFHPPRACSFKPRDDQEQTGFARTGGSGDTERFTSRHLQIHATQNRHWPGQARQRQVHILKVNERGFVQHHAVLYGDPGRKAEGCLHNAIGKLSSQSMQILLALVLLMTTAILPARAAPLELVVLGDSLSSGYGLDPAEGFTIVLEQALRDEGLDIRIVNAGVAGDTSLQGLARLDWSVPEGTKAVLVELGANDALRGKDPAETEKAIDEILTRLKARGIHVLLAGMLAPPNMGTDYETRFNPIFPRLAQKHGVLFYPFFLENVAGNRELNQADGMHPNAQGVQKIVKGILPSVKALAEQLR